MIIKKNETEFTDTKKMFLENHREYVHLFTWKISDRTVNNWLGIGQRFILHVRGIKKLHVLTGNYKIIQGLYIEIFLFPLYGPLSTHEDFNTYFIDTFFIFVAFSLCGGIKRRLVIKVPLFVNNQKRSRT